MAMRRIGAGRGAEQRDGFALGRLLGEDGDALLLFGALHLREIAAAILVQLDRQLAVLAVERRVQFLARSQLTPPQVPGFLLLRQGARTIAADQQAKPVVVLARVVPALR